MKVVFALGISLITLTGATQTNELPATNAIITQLETNLPAMRRQQAEAMRAVCIQGRRSICGKILQVLPEGLVVESGYTNLLREPLTRSWLVPGTVTASRANGLQESSQPGSICIGPVFLTDLPKSRGHKPQRYDYVIIEGYPAGQFTYTSVGTVQHTVRRFSAQLIKAVDFNLQQTNPPAAGVR